MQEYFTLDRQTPFGLLRVKMYSSRHIRFSTVDTITINRVKIYGSTEMEQNGQGEWKTKYWSFNPENDSMKEVSSAARKVIQSLLLDLCSDVCSASRNKAADLANLAVKKEEIIKKNKAILAELINGNQELLKIEDQNREVSGNNRVSLDAADAKGMNVVLAMNPFDIRNILYYASKEMSVAVRSDAPIIQKINDALCFFRESDS